jgi:hypothetical protein
MRAARLQPSGSYPQASGLLYATAARGREIAATRLEPSGGAFYDNLT